MKWEPNIAGKPVVGYPISFWQKDAATRTIEAVDQTNSETVRPHIVEVSHNIMLAHYQRDRH